MTVLGFSPSCRHGLYRAQARCACARRGICLAADRFAATNRPTQSGTAALPQSPRGLGPRSRSALRSMSPLGSSLRAALTPAPTGETCHWHLSPAGRLSQRVGAASFDGFHRSPSLVAPQPLLTNHGGPLNESSRGPPWLQDVRMCSQTRLRRVRCAIRSCPAGPARGLLRRIRDVGFRCAAFAVEAANKGRQPGPCTRLPPLGNLRSTAFQTLIHRARHELGALDAEALRDSLGAEAAPELVIADLEPAVAALEL